MSWNITGMLSNLNATAGPNITNFYPGLTVTSFRNDQCYGNLSLCLDPYYCTLQTCDILSFGQIEYRPSLGANALFAALFAIALIAHLFLGIRYRTIGFMIAMVVGLILEVIGYIGRLMLYTNIFDNNAFLIYLCCLTIAPACLSGAIYLCLARIVVVYGEGLSRFKPRTYTITFCTFDFISLLLQAIGGAMASLANNNVDAQRGINIMIGGLSWQVVSIFLFACFSLEFALRAYRNPLSWNQSHSSLYNSRLWRAFLSGLALATLAIFVRSCYRIAELKGGFGGPLANNQPEFMVLEAAMIGVAVVCLTALHPGVCFKGLWAESNFKLRGKKEGKGEGEVMTLESQDEEMRGQHELKHTLRR